MRRNISRSRCKCMFSHLRLESEIIGVEEVRSSMVSRISFHPVLPKKFDRFFKLQKKILNECLTPPPERILQIVARVSARTPTAAFDNARMSIDLLRAIWCFVLQSAKPSAVPYRAAAAGGGDSPRSASYPSLD